MTSFLINRAPLHPNDQSLVATTVEFEGTVSASQVLTDVFP